MGLVYADLTLKNPQVGLAMPVCALVDTRALLLCVSQHVAI